MHHSITDVSTVNCPTLKLKNNIMSTEWTPTLWSETFSRLVNEQLDRGDSWLLQFSNGLQDHLSSDEIKEGWKVHRRSAYGNFRCGSCSRSWPSAHVTILFHYHLCRETSQGTVIMRSFGQACRRCNKDFRQPGFSTEEVEKVLLKLISMIKKNCYGEDVMSNPCFSVKVPTKPHEASLCEACHQGSCRKED